MCNKVFGMNKKKINRRVRMFRCKDRYFLLLVLSITINLVFMISVGSANSYIYKVSGSAIDPTVYKDVIAYTLGTHGHPLDNDGRGGAIYIEKKRGNQVIWRQHIFSDDGIGSPRIVYNSYLDKLVLHQGSKLNLESPIEKNSLKGEKVELRLQEYKLSGMTEH